MNNWVVIYNRAEAKVYKQVSPVKPLIFIKAYENELGRERNRAMNDDRPGREMFRAGSNATVTHSMDSERDPHEDAAIQFTRMLASELDLERKKGSFEELVLIADPHMVGLLKKNMDKNTLELVGQSINKNVVKLPDHELVNILQQE